MSKSSQAVKDWRIRTKARIIEAMGSKCNICGYNKCNGALELHHIDPDGKEFSFGGIRANPKSWDKIVEELKKCVLLCANCHREVEMRITSLPEGINKFDEEYTEYKSPPVVYKNTCKQCGIEFIKKEDGLQYCSSKQIRIHRSFGFLRFRILERSHLKPVSRFQFLLPFPFSSRSHQQNKI